MFSSTFISSFSPRHISGWLPAPVVSVARALFCFSLVASADPSFRLYLGWRASGLGYIFSFSLTPSLSPLPATRGRYPLSTEAFEEERKDGKKKKKFASPLSVHRLLWKPSKGRIVAYPLAPLLPSSRSPITAAASFFFIPPSAKEKKKMK